MTKTVALDRVAAAEREMRLLMRATVDAFHIYALATVSGSLADRGVEFEQLTLREQADEYERTDTPLKLFYHWLREDMFNVCILDNAATLQ